MRDFYFLDSLKTRSALEGTMQARHSHITARAAAGGPRAVAGNKGVAGASSRAEVCKSAAGPAASACIFARRRSPRAARELGSPSP